MNLNERAAHVSGLDTPVKRQLELRKCRDDAVYWINSYGWTYDPREPVADLPFVLWPKQVEFIHWLEERETIQEDGLVEKSRDAGATWLCCAFAVHRWLFREGDSTGFGSRKENLVDKLGDPDSLFEKMRILIEKLPVWMRPTGWTRDHAAYCKIINPENGSTITGEAGDQIGRGGRKSRYFIDESAFLERAHLVDRSLSQTTRCRIDVSTPNGNGNPFYTKRFSGIPVFTFSWSDDPRKGKAWYEAEKKKRDPVSLAQEVDISYSASIEGVFIPAEWVQAAVGLELPESGPVVAGEDIAEEGRDKTVLIFRRGPKVTYIESWGQVMTNVTTHRTVEEMNKRGASVLFFDSAGVGTGPKGQWNAMAEERTLQWLPVPVMVGEPASEWRYWPDGRNSQQKFSNLKAEIWWMLRDRFERTYEYVNGVGAHAVDTLISIPNHPQLIAELSIPKRQYQGETGKIRVEPKDQLRARGVKSPDFAEALVLAFMDPPAEFNFTPLAKHELATLYVERPREESTADPSAVDEGIDWSKAHF